MKYENRKYEFTGETKTLPGGGIVHRIRAVVTFGCVNAGEIGGWIETPDNLSVAGDAWVAGNACVEGNARVVGNAWVAGNARVAGNACVEGNARVVGNAWVVGDAWVAGNARVEGDARVAGNAWVAGNARVAGNADYVVFRNCWSSYRWFTYTRSNRMWRVGCFLGTGEELIRKAFADNETSGRCYEAIVRAMEQIEDAMRQEGGGIA